MSFACRGFHTPYATMAPSVPNRTAQSRELTARAPGRSSVEGGQRRVQDDLQRQRAQDDRVDGPPAEKRRRRVQLVAVVAWRAPGGPTVSGHAPPARPPAGSRTAGTPPAPPPAARGRRRAPCTRTSLCRGAPTAGFPPAVSRRSRAW